jgi:uncharacterized protein YgiB involved in biofilm formation
MKKSKSIMLLIAPVLSTLLFNACGGGGADESTTRDVYQSREDCLKDWGDEELCSEMNDDDSDEYRRSGGVILAGGRPFWGPSYYPSDRTVLYKGRTISPAGKSTTLRPFTVTARSSSAARSSVSSPRASSSSTSYGGFGSRSSSTSGG